jgi:hypothetical protein
MASRKGCGSPNGGLYKRIDYIYTKGLKATAITRFAQPPPGGDAPSDHAGLIAEFEWPSRTTNPVPPGGAGFSRP